jgi:hypothetical protein
MPSSGTLRRRYRTLRSSACSANVAFAHERSGQRNRRTAKMISTGRQQRNRTLSLPLALRQLEAAGNLGNLRLAIVGKREGYRGPVFMDSDIYKIPGGGRLGELGRGGDQELAAFDGGNDGIAGEGSAAGWVPELGRPGSWPAAVQQPGSQP